MLSFSVSLFVGLLALHLVGKLGWFGDLVALAYPITMLLASAGLAVCLVVARRTAAPAMAAVLLVLAAGVVVPRLPQRTEAPDHALRISAVNLRYDGPTPEAAVASAVTSRPDVLVVSELTRRTDALLRTSFAHRVVSDDLGQPLFAQGVYSNVPLVRLQPTADVEGHWLRVRVDGAAPFVLYSLHLLRPSIRRSDATGYTSFAGLREAALTIDRMADRELGPVVIAGDLNLSDRTSGYRALLENRRDAMRGAWATRTYVGSGLTWRLASLRIDHVLVPRNWCHRDSGTFAISGSDHRGVRAVIGPCPSDG